MKVWKIDETQLVNIFIEVKDFICTINEANLIIILQHEY